METFNIVVCPEDLTAAKRYLSERVVIDEKTGCWNWKLKKGINGYGLAQWKRGKPLLSHRFAFAVGNNGIIHTRNKEGLPLVVRHSEVCETICCNPNHLKLGTLSDNSRDKLKKGTDSNGEKSTNCIITEETAKKIIYSKFPKNHANYKTQYQRSLLTGVSIHIIKHIDTGRTWKHLPRNTQEETDFISQKRFKPRKQFCWSMEYVEEAFGKIKSKCDYTKEFNKFTNTQCLEWKGNLHKGRPVYNLRGRQTYAYVYACEFNCKRQKKEYEITRHLCNNMVCCEPTHLVFGSHAENSHDSLIFCADKRFKLSLDTAKEIRSLYIEADTTQKNLSEKFGVDPTTISAVLNKKTWNC